MAAAVVPPGGPGVGAAEGVLDVLQRGAEAEGLLGLKGALRFRTGDSVLRGHNTPYEAFVAKIAPGGDRLVYSTYLGGNAGDIARSIDVDRAGSAFVVGSTGSSDRPTVKPFQATMRGKRCGPPPGEPCRQAFLTRLRPNGGSASYSTYLGGREHDDAYSVAVDRNRQAHVTGSTQSCDLPTQKAFQTTLDNRGCTSEQPTKLCDDGFVTKFRANGTAQVRRLPRRLRHQAPAQREAVVEHVPRREGR